jgi:hypothetical protein
LANKGQKRLTFWFFAKHHARSSPKLPEVTRRSTADRGARSRHQELHLDEQPYGITLEISGKSPGGGFYLALDFAPQLEHLRDSFCRPRHSPNFMVYRSNSMAAFSHRNSPKNFTQQRFFACLFLKNFLRTDDRGLCRIIRDFLELAEAIQLPCIQPVATSNRSA